MLHTVQVCLAVETPVAVAKGFKMFGHVAKETFQSMAKISQEPSTWDLGRLELQ